MSNPLIPKSRRVRFHLHLHIHDLNNVPLVSGTSFVKWHLPSSNAAEHRGKTPKCAIKDHRVLYDYAKTIPVRLSLAKDGMLQSSEIAFEIVQEYSAGGRAERIKLGELRLNLAEYCGLDDSHTMPGAGAKEGGEHEPGIVRRYLMQESKINSTLRIGIYMKQIEGTRDFVAPPLRTAPVFGGIAGIISSSEPANTTPQADASSNEVTDGQALPILGVTNKEMGEMQDMYRRTLAAYWASYPGELRADECIEDIFSGGDGWGKHGRPGKTSAPGNENSQSGSGASTPNPSGGDGKEHSNGMRSSTTHHRNFAGSKYGNFGKHVRGMRAAPSKVPGEINEFDVRDDLRSWVISEKAYG